MKTLALDPATRTGFCYGSAAPPAGVTFGVWDLGPAERRLLSLRQKIYAVHRQFGIERIAYELSSLGAGGRKGEGGPQWQTIVFHIELRTIIKAVAQEIGAELQGVHIGSIKAFATGSGKADKRPIIPS